MQRAPEGALCMSGFACLVLKQARQHAAPVWIRSDHPGSGAIAFGHMRLQRVQ